MKMQGILLAIVGVTVSLIIAIVLIGYSKHSITKTMARHQVLRLLKMQGMSHDELLTGAKEHSVLVSPKLISVMLRKLESEDLIQKTGGNRYVITTKGLDELKNLESMKGELLKVAKIVKKTSMVSKILVTEAIDRIASMNEHIIYKTYTDSSQAQESKTAIPRDDRQNLQMISQEGMNFK